MKSANIAALVAFIAIWSPWTLASSKLRARIDLASLETQWLEEAATQVSKPYGERMEPLKWSEIIAKTGRTSDEIAALQDSLVAAGGTVEGVCQSKLCLFAHVHKNGSTPEEVAPMVHTYLRHSLLLSGFSETMVAGVTLLFPADDLQENDKRIFSLGTSPHYHPPASYDNFPGYTLSSINNEILMKRLNNETNETLHDLNRLSFYSFPVFCNGSSITMDGFINVPLEGGNVSCPQTLTIRYTSWKTDAFGFDTKIQEITIDTTNILSETCASILGSFFCVDESVLYLGFEQVNLQWRNDSLVWTLDFANYLPLGATYFILDITYSDGFVLELNSYMSLGPTITPSYASNIYNVPEGHRGAGLGVTALYAPGTNAYSKLALEIANTAFGLPTPTIALFKSSFFPGMNTSQCYFGNCYESGLDVQMISQYGAGAKFGFIPSNNYNFNYTTVDSLVLQNFVGYREALIEQDIYPDVLSLSWGASGSEVDYQSDLNDILMAFSAAGITVLAASGDRGAVGEGYFECSADNLTVFDGVTPTMYSWVLSVGATQQAQLPGTNGDVGTVTCMGPTSLAITSTGKIFPSDLIAMPDYQAEAVADYLNSEEFKNWNYPPRTIASPGRSIPDVSAFGAFIPTMLEDFGAPFADNVGGTSASSPAFAGLLLQVRGALLQAPECANKTIKFGHINPMIYWMLKNRPDAFTDITVGNNVYDGQYGYTYDLTNCGQGYVAAKGWDPVTGVGIMNFPGFVEAAKEWMCLGCQVFNRVLLPALAKTSHARLSAIAAPASLAVLARNRPTAPARNAQRKTKCVRVTLIAARR